MLNDRERSESISRLGRAGEVIFGNYMSKLGQPVEFSVDQFDSRKDLKIGEKTYEVKTQVPFVTENAFTIRENQLRKLQTADYTVFVSVPNVSRSHWSEGKVYIIESSKINSVIRRRKTKDGRTMILLPISAMNELFTITENECKLLQKYSVSDWN